MYTDAYPTALSQQSFDDAVMVAWTLQQKTPEAPLHACVAKAVRTTFCRCMDCDCGAAGCSRCTIFAATIDEVERRLHERQADGDVPPPETAAAPPPDQPHCLFAVASAAITDLERPATCRYRQAPQSDAD